MALSVSQKVVLARENSWGVAETVSTDQYALPIETANINLVVDPFNDQTKKGAASLDSNVYATVRRSEGSIEGPFFVDEASLFILALLGDENAAVGAGSPNTHTFIAKTNFAAPLANSLTITQRDDALNLEALGCYVSSYTLRFSAAEGIVSYSANMMGKDLSTTIALTDVAFADQPAPFGWTGTVYYDEGNVSRIADNHATIIAGAKDCSIIDAEFTINRPTAMTYTFCDDAQTAFRADPGPLEVTARFTADWDGSGAASEITPETWFAAYRDNTQAGWVFRLDNNGTATGATYSYRSIDIYLPAASIIDAPLEIDRSDTAMRVTLGVRAVHNSVAAINGPIVIRTGGSREEKYTATLS